MTVPRAFVSRLLGWSGLSRAARLLLTRGGSFVLIFHGVASRRYRGVAASAQPSMDAAELRRTLDWIGSRFRFLTPEDFLRSEPGVLLTFDDGFANNGHVVLPLLEESGSPAVFFVTTQHVSQPRNWLPATRRQATSHWPRLEDVPDEVARDLYDGMSEGELARCAEHPLITIGAHTVSHPFLTRCNEAQLAYELEAAKSQLESAIGTEVDLLAYPTGDYDRRVAEAARRAGYRFAFVQDTSDVGLPAYEIPRVGIYSDDPAYLAAKLSGLHRRALRRIPDVS